MNKPASKHSFFQTKPFGFTLVELLIAVLIISISIGLAVPSFRSLISNSRMVSETNKIVEALNIARSKAVSSHFNVVVAPIGSDWNGGFQVFTDKNNDQIPDIGEVIQTYAPTTEQITILSTFVNRVTYRPDGRAVAGSFDICSDDQLADYRHIAIALTGRIRTVEPEENGKTYTEVCP